MRTRPRPGLRVLLVAAAAATVLAGCGGDEGPTAAGDDGTTGEVADDPDPVETDGDTGGAPEGSPDTDGPAVDDRPADDGASDDGASDDGATDDGGTPASGEVPPLLDVIDGWPETEVVFPDADVSFQVKVADEPDRRQQGLMNVPDLPDGVGMLFTFEESRTGGFWMRDTLVPLDIAYLAGGEVVAILQMDPCPPDEADCEIYDPGTEYDAALEVGQGVLGEVGVAEGDTATWDLPRDLAGA